VLFEIICKPSVRRSRISFKAFSKTLPRELLMMDV